MAYEIVEVELEDTFKNCPICGYEDGFHTMLKKEKNIIKWLFICPSCHAVFDTGHILKE